MSDFVKDINVPTNDYISRQAAIDALNEKCLMPVWCKVLVKKMLTDLPSAEPDWNEMVVICDCCGHAIHVKRI